MAKAIRSFDPKAPPTGAAAISDNPQEDWGEPADEGAVYSANHTTRGGKPDRASGPKTRAATKDQISRRS